MNLSTIRLIPRTLLAAILASLFTWANALELKPYSSTELAALQAKGQSVAVHFHADWCSTCISQSRSVESLKSDPKLKDVTVLIADYDKEKALRRELKVRNQSVFVVFKGQQEVSRINGLTKPDDIRAGLLKAL